MSDWDRILQQNTEIAARQWAYNQKPSNNSGGGCLGFILLLGFILHQCNSNPSPPPQHQAISKTYLFRKPQANSKTKMYIIKGDKVRVLRISKNKQWYFVRYKKKKGGNLDMWVKKNKIVKTP